jgi:hypothetical protein
MPATTTQGQSIETAAERVWRTDHLAKAICSHANLDALCSLIWVSRAAHRVTVPYLWSGELERRPANEIEATLRRVKCPVSAERRI